jgi:hypothetical protein
MYVVMSYICTCSTMCHQTSHVLSLQGHLVLCNSYKSCVYIKAAEWVPVCGGDIVLEASAFLPTVLLYFSKGRRQLGSQPQRAHTNLSFSRFCYSYFLPSPRRYSSRWALASWIISLHFSLFFVCSDDEASSGRVKKSEECGWKRSWPTYFRWFCIHSIRPRLIIWFLNNLIFTVWGC